jgi:hypothetical protein
MLGLNSVRDGFGKCLDARSTLILTERDAVVLDQMARVNRQRAVTSREPGDYWAGRGAAPAAWRARHADLLPVFEPRPGGDGCD